MRDQKKLKKEALDVMEKLRLVEILEKYGDTRLVGSVVLELIVKLDIDIHVLLSHGNLMDITNKITSKLLSIEGIREVRITDYHWVDGGKA